MVILKKAKGDTSGIKGGLKSIFGAFKDEGIEQLKEVKKDIARSLTGDPGGDKPKSWEDEWLKDKDKNKPPVSEKEEGHSKIDPAKMMKGSDEQNLEATRRKIAAALNSQYYRPSQTSEYGKQQAQKYQEEHKPVYDKQQQEAEQKRQQQQKAAAQQQGQGLAMPTKGTSNRGSVLSKKKHKPSPMELNRAEFRGAKGK